MLYFIHFINFHDVGCFYDSSGPMMAYVELTPSKTTALPSSPDMLASCCRQEHVGCKTFLQQNHRVWAPWA